MLERVPTPISELQNSKGDSQTQPPEHVLICTGTQELPSAAHVPTHPHGLTFVYAATDTEDSELEA
jgi:hypothetical protein